jgi:hypothetical protein
MQPLSHVKPGARIHRNINTMFCYPNITSGIAVCISTYAEMELNLGILLSALLRAEANAVLAMYASVENRAAQMRMLYAAVNAAKIPADQKDIAEAILRYFVRPVTKERDRMVHWCWGYTPDIKDALLLFEPTPELSRLSEIWQSGEWADIDPERVFVITQEDMHRAMGRFETAQSYLVQLIGILIEQPPIPPPEIRAAMLHSLSSAPQIQEALSRLRESRKNNQSIPD